MKKVIAYAGTVKNFRKLLERLQESERKSFSSNLLRGSVSPRDYSEDPEKYYLTIRKADTFKFSASVDRNFLRVLKFKYDKEWLKNG